MKYPVMFSIPVHEAPEVVIDQIKNIMFYNPGCGIVLHISAQFDYGEMDEAWFLRMLDDFDQVYVNPIRCDTKWGMITQCHISNYLFVSEQTSFEYFCLITSNNMFVRSGLIETTRSKKKAYITGFKVVERPDWIQGQKALLDNDLQNMLSDIHKTPQDIWGAEHEGTIYQNKVFGRICEIINARYDYQNVEIHYPREEVYLPTLVMNLAEEHEIGWVKRNYMDFERGLVITKEDIDAIKNQQMENKNFCMLKRIPRTIDDPLREYIRSNP